MKNNFLDNQMLDVIMPNIDGIQACTTFRDDPTYKDLSIIIGTGDDSDETLEKVFEQGRMTLPQS